MFLRLTFQKSCFVFAVAVAIALPASPFLHDGDAGEVYAYQSSEHLIFGHPALRQAYLQRVPIDGTGPSIMQRSGRKRLYDHNLFLRALWQHRLHHAKDGDLGPLFLDAVFIDIGSAILNGEGAPTVRDLREDPLVYPNLHRLVATDINDPETRYIDLYHRAGRVYPFEVREVPLDLSTAEQVRDLVQDLRHPVMFRSANAGPDLYYLPSSMPAHFAALAAGVGKRPILYFFGKYVLYKGPAREQFEILGTIDYDMGFNHRWPAWTQANWYQRTLSEAFTPRRVAVTAPPSPGSPSDNPRGIAYLRATSWQKEVASDLGAWEVEADRQLAQALTRAAMAYQETKKRPPATLAEVAKYALTLAPYDFKRLDHLDFDAKTLTVSLKP